MSTDISIQIIIVLVDNVFVDERSMRALYLRKHRDCILVFQLYFI